MYKEHFGFQEDSLLEDYSIPEEISEDFVRNYERWVRGEPLISLVDRGKGY